MNLRKSLENFNRKLDNKLIVASENELDIFRVIKEDLLELDYAMFNQVKGILFDRSSAEYEEKVYFFDWEIAQGLMSESDIEYTPHNFNTTGIGYDYAEGLFKSGKLGMYNVYKNMYVSKCYNLYDYPIIMDTFVDDYDKSLKKVFDRYSKYTKLEVSDAKKRFEELFKNNLI